MVAVSKGLQERQAAMKIYIDYSDGAYTYKVLDSKALARLPSHAQTVYLAYWRYIAFGLVNKLAGWQANWLCTEDNKLQ